MIYALICGATVDNVIVLDDPGLLDDPIFAAVLGPCTPVDVTDAAPQRPGPGWEAHQGELTWTGYSTLGMWQFRPPAPGADWTWDDTAHVWVAPPEPPPAP